MTLKQLNFLRNLELKKKAKLERHFKKVMKRDNNQTSFTYKVMSHIVPQ